MKRPTSHQLGSRPAIETFGLLRGGTIWRKEEFQRVAGKRQEPRRGPSIKWYIGKKAENLEWGTSPLSLGGGRRRALVVQEKGMRIGWMAGNSVISCWCADSDKGAYKRNRNGVMKLTGYIVYH